MRRWLGVVIGLFLAMSQATSLAHAERIALVIGNDLYPNLPKDQQLAKAVNDARTMGDALEAIGFTVIRGENLDRQAMIDRVFAFTQAIKPGDTALLFYAGHGVAIGGGNYLLPSDVRTANPGEEARVRAMAIGEADIIADIQDRKAQVAILMLDACRDNPFKQPGLTRSAGASRGLARSAEAEGVFAIYSAGFGQTALDTLGGSDASPNSVFTRVMAPALRNKGVHLADLVIDVRQQVAALAETISHQQNPAYYDQTRGGRIYLVPDDGGNAAAKTPPVQQAVVIAPPMPAIAPADRKGSVGRVWVVQEHGNWRGIWTRRGTSDTFDAISGDNLDTARGPQAGGGAVDLSVAEMEIRDGRILIRRKFPHVVCIYEGQLAVDGLSAVGTYECNHVGGRYRWSARISDTLPAGPRNDWRGQVWQSDEGGDDWKGIWQRRGRSSLFDAEWRDVNNGGYDSSQLYISVDGDNVTVFRHQEKGRCVYTGKLQKDRKTIIGSVTCNWVRNAPWRASLIN
jgi:uncharacterized caspase-like protein